MYRKGSSVWSSMFANEEFQETDVWSVINERKDYDSNSVKSKGSSASGYSSRTNSHPTAARMIPRPSTNNSDIESRVPKQQSAPVNIPDWSKIYGKSKRSSQKSAFLDCGYDVGDGVHYNRKESWDSDDDDYRVDGNMMPPHEWIAQKLARNQISSFSVCEGAGRTLKGRDLSRGYDNSPVWSSIELPVAENFRFVFVGRDARMAPKRAKNARQRQHQAVREWLTTSTSVKSIVLATVF